ncbi:MAG TPA: hypothetical protein VH643_40055 [Gemmataceae bacterium]
MGDGYVYLTFPMEADRDKARQLVGTTMVVRGTLALGQFHQYAGDAASPKLAPIVVTSELSKAN